MDKAQKWRPIVKGIGLTSKKNMKKIKSIDEFYDRLFEQLLYSHLLEELKKPIVNISS